MAKAGRPPKKGTIDKHLHIRIDATMLDRIRAAADERGQSVTVFVLRAVAGALPAEVANNDAT